MRRGFPTASKYRCCLMVLDCVIVFILIRRSLLRRFAIFLAIVKIFADEAGEKL